MDISGLVQDVFKSTDEVVKRIFNHKPFLEAQLQTMAKEFDKYEGHDINKINENLLNVKNDSFVSVEEKCNSLNKICDHVEKLETSMNQLLNLEKTKELERKTKLSEFLAEKNEDLVKFMEHINSKIDDIDNSYIKARQDIDYKYKNKK